MSLNSTINNAVSGEKKKGVVLIHEWSINEIFNTDNEDRPLSESWLEVRTCLSIAPSET